jgi:hypothetical protein
VGLWGPDSDDGRSPPSDSVRLRFDQWLRLSTEPGTAGVLKTLGAFAAESNAGSHLNSKTACHRGDRRPHHVDGPHTVLAARCLRTLAAPFRNRRRTSPHLSRQLASVGLVCPMPTHVTNEPLGLLLAEIFRVREIR